MPGTQFYRTSLCHCPDVASSGASRGRKSSPLTRRTRTSTAAVVPSVLMLRSNVLSSVSGRQGRSEILPRRLDRRGGASVVRRPPRTERRISMSKSAKKRPAMSSAITPSHRAITSGCRAPRLIRSAISINRARSISAVIVQNSSMISRARACAAPASPRLLKFSLALVPSTPPPPVRRRPLRSSCELR